MASGANGERRAVGERQRHVDKRLLQSEAVNVQGSFSTGKVTVTGQRGLALDEGADVIAEMDVGVQGEPPEEERVIRIGRCPETEI